MKKIILKLSALIFTVIILVSCAQKEKGQKTEVEKVNKKSITTVIENREYVFDTKYSNSIQNDAILAQLFEGLTSYSSHEKVSLNQAEEIKKNEKFTLWNIKLREDLKWSDGSKITAGDYINSWLEVLDKDKNSPHFYRLFIIKNAKKYYEKKIALSELGIKKISDTEIQIELEKPMKNFDEFLSNVFMFPTKKDGEKLLFNSAFVLESKKEKEIILKKNKNYWDAVNNRIEEVILKISEDDILSYQLFDLNQIDFVGLPFFEIPYERRLESSKRPEFISFKTNIFDFLEYNPNSSIFKDEELKTMLQKFVDSEFIANIILYNNSEPIVENKKLISNEIQKLKDDFKATKKKLNLKLFYNDTKLEERILASISKEWISNYEAKISIKKQYEYDLKYARFNSGTTDKSDIKYYINHKYQNDEIDKIYTKNEEILNDHYIIPLYNRSFSTLVNKNIQGYDVAPNGQILIKNIVKR